MIKKLALSLIRRAGYELRPKDGPPSQAAALAQLARAGLAPASIIDVGAAHGGFARAAHARFPAARLALVEPLSEFAGRLAALAGDIPGTEIVAAVAAAAEGEARLNVHDDLVGSSLLTEAEEVNGTPRTVPAVTVDGLARRFGLTAPYMLKVDVQGAELAVLDGAREVLAQASSVILEVSFLPFFEGGALFAQVVAAMAAHGFSVYDLAGLSHRPLDGAMAQADVVFVRTDAPCRADRRFALPEQRRALTRRLAAAN
jgi:FkbM family methyltransferase